MVKFSTKKAASKRTEQTKEKWRERETVCGWLVGDFG